VVRHGKTGVLVEYHSKYICIEYIRIEKKPNFRPLERASLSRCFVVMTVIYVKQSNLEPEAIHQYPHVGEHA